MESFSYSLSTSIAGLNNSTVDANALPDVDFDNFEQLWFESKVDHFDNQNNATFQMRYWRMDDYWTDTTGPNFIYFCGEYTCSPPSDRHYPFQVGADKAARLFVIEHRFYGASQPCEDWSVDCYQTLSSEQGLADFAYFLSVMNSDYVQRPTVVIGGSYPGALSAWFRDKYPQWATASWAASAVVQPWEDMWSYDEQIYQSTYNIDPDCATMLQDTTKYATQQVLLRYDGMPNTVDTVLNGTGAENMTGDDFLSYYADMPVGLVQYGGAQQLCDTILPYIDSTDEEIFLMANDYFISSGDSPADYDTTSESAKILNQTIDVDYSGRSWTYQYCTEFGFFQTPSHINRVRSVFLDDDYWLENCQLVFPALNMTMFPNTKRTQYIYGGNKIQATNIFFTNGSEDPWQWVTQLEDRPWINQRSKISNCTGCAHCADLYTPSASDPADLNQTRQDVYDWITEILDDYQTNMNAQNILNEVQI